jgi:membrane associated rhomboid family serine protease
MALPLRDDVPVRRTAWVTIALIAINVIVFLFVQPSAFQNPPDREDAPTYRDFQRSVEATEFSYRWGAVPCEIESGTQVSERPGACDEWVPVNPDEHKSVYLALLTCMFLHGSVLHLAGNMLFLWVFGNNVEDRLGRLGYLALYLIGGVIATLGFVVTNAGSSEPVIGASGAIAAAMGAYLVFHPRGRVLTVVATAAVQLVYVPAAVVLGLFFVTQFFTGEESVAWEAHAVGMVAGALVALAVARLGRRPAPAPF